MDIILYTCRPAGALGHLDAYVLYTCRTSGAFCWCIDSLVHWLIYLMNSIHIALRWSAEVDLIAVL